MYQRTRRRVVRAPVVYQSLGDGTAVAVPAATGSSFSLTDFVHSDSFETGASLALTYHGYKRTGSLIWALIYGVAGKWFPVVSVPVALAQGFGEKKPCP